ncbi:hypothetical protein AAIG88_32135, partial [Pseudomonas aeruginosa]
MLPLPGRVPGNNFAGRQNTNLTLDVNIIDFPSIPVAMLPHRCSPELLIYSVAKFIMWRKETGLSPVNQ